MGAKGWPVWRTDPTAYRPLGAGLWCAISLIAWVLPPAIGGLIIGVLNLLRLEQHSPFHEIDAVAGMLLTSGLFAWVGIPIGILICRLALRAGWAGWAVAVLMGLVLPTLIFCILLGTFSFWGIMAFFGLIGTAYAGSLWLGLRWLAPELFGVSPE